MSRVREYIGPGVVLKDGTASENFVADNNITVVGLVFLTNKKPEAMTWVRDKLTPFYRTVKADQAGNEFDMILVCPDESDADYAACAQAVPCPALAKGDPMINAFIRMHKVSEVPTLCVLAEDATQITADGVLEMDPPPGGG